MCVEFKNKYNRYSNIVEIEKYKINNIYKKEKIINILKNDYNSNIGTIYTYSDILDTINNTLKDESIDNLLKNFENKHNIVEYPITIKNIFAYPQTITLIKEDTNADLKYNLNYTADLIKSVINENIDSLYLFRYKKLISKNISDTLNIAFLAKNLFDIELLVDLDFKIIDSYDSEGKFLWLGKGAIESDNSASYQWLFDIT